MIQFYEAVFGSGHFLTHKMKGKIEKGTRSNFARSTTNRGCGIKPINGETNPWVGRPRRRRRRRFQTKSL